jgi:SOS response regulatory protein OraA/RecX
MRRLDYKEQLSDYLKKNLAKGYTIESLKFALTNQGYSRVSIEQALEQVHKDLAEKAPPVAEKPVIKYSLYDEYNKQVHIEQNSFWAKLKAAMKSKKLK